MIPTIEELMAFLKQDTRVRYVELVVDTVKTDVKPDYVLRITMDTYSGSNDQNTVDKIEIESDSWTALCVLVGEHPHFSSNYAMRAHDAITRGGTLSASAYGKLGTYAAHKREENG